MKSIRILMMLVAVSMAGGATQAYANAFEPVLKSITPEKVFTPAGFDSNDHSQIIVAGSYRNTCYKVAPDEATVDADKFKIYVRSRAYFYDGCFCAMVLVPYVKTIELGVLKAGKYDVYFEDATGAMKQTSSLNVAVSPTAEPDNYVYAPLTDAAVDTSTVGADPVLMLKGRFTSTCMKIREVKINFVQGNVVEVLPIMADKPDEYNDPSCKDASIPFEERVVVKGAPKGQTLFHIRALNGKALNVVSQID
jgi:hypothetical protein